MGLFKSIGKAFKKVVKGVKKVFKKVTSFVGKLMDKKWFKWLMIGAAIFTVGVALYAGVTAGMAAQGGLLAKTVTGAKAFMGALMSPVATAKAAFAGELSVAARTAQAAGGLATTAMPGAAGAVGVEGTGIGVDALAGSGVAPGTGGFTGMPGAVVGGSEAATAVGGVAPAGGTIEASGFLSPQQTNMASAIGNADPVGGAISQGNARVAAIRANMQSLPQAPTPAPGFLSKAAAGAGKFFNSTGGGMLLAGLIQGYGQGKMLEDERKERQRIERLWNDPAAMEPLNRITSQPVEVPAGWNNTAPIWQVRNQYPPTVEYA